MTFQGSGNRRSSIGQSINEKAARNRWRSSDSRLNDTLASLQEVEETHASVCFVPTIRAGEGGMICLTLCALFTSASANAACRPGSTPAIQNGQEVSSQPARLNAPRCLRPSTRNLKARGSTTTASRSVPTGLVLASPVPMAAKSVSRTPSCAAGPDRNAGLLFAAGPDRTPPLRLVGPDGRRGLGGRRSPGDHHLGLDRPGQKRGARPGACAPPPIAFLSGDPT